MNKVTGEVVGAVGISGDTSEKDEYVAIEGIKSTQLQVSFAAPWLLDDLKLMRCLSLNESNETVRLTFALFFC